MVYAVEMVMGYGIFLRRSLIDGGILLDRHVRLLSVLKAGIVVVDDSRDL